MNKLIGVLVVTITVIETAMVCDKHAAAQLFKVPAKLDCEEGHEEAFSVQLEKTNVKQYTVKARRLIVSRKTCKVAQQFFGAREVETSEERLLWSKNKYLKHMNSKTCVTNEGQTVQRTGKVKPKCQTKWMKTTVNAQIQCLYQEGYVAISHRGGMISNLGEVHSCTNSYNGGFCITQQKEAIHFIPNETAEKDYLPVGNFSAIQVGTHLIIGDIGFSVNIDEKIKLDTYYERNGFRIKRNNPNTVTQVGLNLTTVDNAIEEVRQELLTKLNFLSDQITLKTHKIKSLCEAIQMTQDIARILAVTNPTAYARSILHNEFLIADSEHITGSFIRVTPCKNVTNMRFRDVYQNQCYRDLPVTYELAGKEHKGFLDIETRIIAPTAVRVNCSNKLSKFVEMGTDVFIYSPGSVPQRVNTSKAIEMPLFKTDIYKDLFHFPDKFIYETSEIIQIDDSKAGLEYLENKLTDTQTRIEEVENQQHPVNTLKGFIKLKFEHVIAGLITWATRLGAIFGWIYCIKLIKDSNMLHRIPQPRLRISFSQTTSPRQAPEQQSETLL